MMRYKASNKDPANRWRSKNQYRLERAGIPHDVVVDNHRFWFVVQEGIDLCESGWTVTWITNEQAAELLSVLVEFLGGDRSWDLIDHLHRKLEGREVYV